MNNEWKLTLALLGLLLIPQTGYSQATQPTTQPTTAPVYSPEAIRGGAEQTYVNYSRAWREGQEADRTQIAEKYWTAQIRSLKPIRVYTHRANIVVVQKLEQDMEIGKYMRLMISSYLPMNGVDGFEYTPNPRTGIRYSTGTGVWDYKRISAEPIAPLPINR